MKKIDLIELTPGYTISRLIKGGWQLAGGHGNIDQQTAITDMFAFVEASIITFDCADIYTGVEEMIGTFRSQFKSKFGEQELKRIKVHTKFVPDYDQLASINKADVTKIIDRSLQRLQIEQLDLVQFHWWDFSIPRYVETYSYLMDLQKQGKIQNIGVTNFDTIHLQEIKTSLNALPVSNQVQYSILDNRPEQTMVNFCQENSMKLLCYGTAAGGFLSEKYLNKSEPEHPLENRSLTKYKLIIEDIGGWNVFQNILQTLSEIAKKYNTDIATVAGRYILERPGVAAIIVGARNTDHLKNHLQLFEFSLDKKDYENINRVLKTKAKLLGDIYALERDKTGRHGSIMKYHLNKNN